MCDDQCIKGLAADVWIRGGERPLQNVKMKAIVTCRPSFSDLNAVFDDFFAKVKRCLDAHATGPETFHQPISLFYSHLDRGDGTAAFQRLHSFGVTNGTSFSDYFRSFRVVVSSVTGFENILAPNVCVVLALDWRT